MNKEYEYRCVDKSVLTPTFRKKITEPILKIIPIGIHPNLITTVSFIFSLIALYISYSYQRGMIVNMIISLFIFSYLLFDHLDGMQAKRRGGGTALGEFFDHFFDILVNGIIMFTLIYLFNITNQIVLLLIITSSYITQAMVFLEQRESGWLHFGKIESLEAVLFLCVLILFDGFDVVRDFLVLEVFANWRLIDILLVISSLAGLKVILESYMRIKWQILPLSILLFTVGFILYYTESLGLEPITQLLVISISSVMIIQEYLIGHLTNKKYILIEFIPFILFVALTLVLNFNSLVFVLSISFMVIMRFIITANLLSQSK